MGLRERRCCGGHQGARAPRRDSPRARPGNGAGRTKGPAAASAGPCCPPMQRARNCGEPASVQGAGRLARLRAVPVNAAKVVQRMPGRERPWIQPRADTGKPWKNRPNPKSGSSLAAFGMFRNRVQLLPATSSQCEKGFQSSEAEVGFLGGVLTCQPCAPAR